MARMPSSTGAAASPPPLKSGWIFFVAGPVSEATSTPPPGTFKWRFDPGQSPLVAICRLSLAAEAIDTGLGPYFLTVEVIGAGRQPQAASNLVDVIKDLVDQGAEPRTLLSLLRCLLVDHRAPPTAMFTGTIEPRIMVNEK
jgi:hypothetical protein